MGFASTPPLRLLEKDVESEDSFPPALIEIDIEQVSKI